MSSERWRQIEELYHFARERGGEALAGADPEIRKEVERLLAQDSVGDKLLDQNATDLIADSADAQVAPGTKLGPYRIEEMLGRGGMGQVYRATDTRLERRVAIKICNRAFLDRFKRESQSIAAINHPNVCTLYDVGPNYLVMELVEGETMAARLERGKLTVAQTLRFGAQIAAALAVAHARGIVHRDLKPANVMLVKSQVKVLDFGLARSQRDQTLTQPGYVIGTPAYMAPEQTEGKEADERADIYALGLILAEMATGRFSRLPTELPPALERVIRRCLETDPEERWQSASDLQWELESIAQASPSPGSRPRFPLWALALGGIAAIALVAFVVLRAGQRPLPQPLARLNILLPEKSRVLSLAVSPDGRSIAMVLVKDGKQQIWIRALDSLDMAPLAGTDNAADPFWSADGRYIGFIADAKLKKIESAGGPVQTLGGALGTLGATWNRKGDILLGNLSRVQRVSDGGGPVTDLPGHDRFGPEVYPSFLPDGVHYLATRTSGVWLDSMNGPEEKHLLPDVSNASLVPPTPGEQVGAVLFTRAGTLMALPFDLKHLEPVGDAVPVVHGVATSRSSLWLAATAAHAPVLTYVAGAGSQWQYVWRDRQGKVLGSAGEAGAVATISPDGKRLLGDHRGGGLWVQDFATGVSTRVTLGQESNPIWSPDGRWIAYFKNDGISRKAATGAGMEEVLLKTHAFSVPKSWSPDGRYIIYAQIDPGAGADLFAFPLAGDRKPVVLANSSANEDQGQFSPDGHWVAYTSNESGLSEIYVISFPPASDGGKWMVSRGGGVQPRWRRDGKELFYIAPDWKMMAAPVSTTSVFQSGTPRPLFDSEMADTSIRTGPISWDISPDGKRFLIVSDKSQETSSLNVILNWRPAEQTREQK